MARAETVEAPELARPGQRRAAGGGPSRAAVAGIAAAALALGVSELLAGLVGAAPSLVLAVGARVVDAVPAPVKNFAIAVFGTADKKALLVGIVVLSVAAGAALGVAARRRFALGVAGFAAFALLGAWAATREIQSSALLGAASAVVSATAGVGALRLLLGAATAADTAPRSGTGGGRRAFLRLAGIAATAAVASAVVGRSLVQRTAVVGTRAGLVMPPPARVLPPPPETATLDVEGLTPLFTPNADFYRIDTALSVPRVDVATWRLKVGGMVDRPFELSYDELQALGVVEVDVTIACVSNEVGGGLIGNARWLGVPLAAVLERAGVQDGASQVVGRSVDGWTAGFPTELALDGRNAVVAVGMNGEPLPLEHGFPARLVVPGVYGYVSATKWLAEIELTTWEAFDGYWVPRGWAKEGPIKTQSRIDVPRAGAAVAAGRQPIAGVAWAQHRGVEAVEVQVDDGAWEPARLAEELDVDVWRQWVLEWDATPGPHVLRVRATDADGATQTEQRTPVAPDGASGWHTVHVNVT